MDEFGLSVGGRVTPTPRKWKQGTPRGLLDQIAVLSHFIGEEFVGVHVYRAQRKVHGTSFSNWLRAARCCCPLTRRLGGKPEHTLSPLLLLLLLLVNQPEKPDNNQERFTELITKIQSWVVFEVKSPKQWNWREETENLRITFLLGSKQMQTFSGYSSRKCINYTK